MDSAAPCQDYVATQLANIIGDNVQFVDPVQNENQDVPEDVSYGIRLFTNSMVPLVVAANDDIIRPTIKAKKRKATTSTEDEASKIASCVVEPAFIIDQIELRGWHYNPKRQHRKLDKYNLRKGVLYPVTEEINEFTELRKKNNWDTKKICQPIKRILN